jgi:hypothetical protein
MRILAGILTFVFGGALIETRACAGEAPKEIIAAHIRQQGYRCDAPKIAKRDPHASRPDEAVWILTCSNARYRVRLIPDMAAVVEPL